MGRPNRGTGSAGPKRPGGSGGKEQYIVSETNAEEVDEQPTEETSKDSKDSKEEDTSKE